MNSSDVRKSLRLFYPELEYALFHEVANSTGGGATNYADALAFCLYPSRGLHITGIEIKVSRNDWISELKNPKKAEAVAKYCDFWVMATPPDIIKPDELPESWGHLLIPLDGGKPKMVKKPLRGKAEAMPRGFIASIMRRAQDQIETRRHQIIYEAQAEQKQREYQAVEEAGKLRYENRNLTSSRDSIQKTIDEFEQASGIKISAYHGGRVGQQFALFQKLMEFSTGPALQSIAGSVLSIAQGAKEIEKLAQAALEEKEGIRLAVTCHSVTTPSQ